MWRSSIPLVELRPDHCSQLVLGSLPKAERQPLERTPSGALPRERASLEPLADAQPHSSRAVPHRRTPRTASQTCRSRCRRRFPVPSARHLPVPRNLTEGYHRSSTSADAAVQNLPVWTTVAVVHPVKRGAGGHVGVVGAGVAGMAAAIRLAEAGASVSVFDPAPAAGGLAGGFSVGGGSVERFYHHIFHSDKTSQRWINDLGLGAHLEWLPASMGFYSGGNLYRFGTPLSLLAFRPLSVVDRVRMGLRIRGLSSQPSPDPFEEITAVEWLRQRCSERELEVFWHPMLEAKFGPDSEAVSMAWLWARFRARVGGSAGLRERLGYLRGGFQQLGDRMADRALELGVEVHFGSRVREVQIDEHGVAALSDADGRRFAVDAIVWTPILNSLARAVPALIADYRQVCAGIGYHHAVVMVVELESSALPYYWVT